MKIIIIILVFSILFSCNEDTSVEPETLKYHLSIVNSAGGDFFDESKNYEADSVDLISLYNEIRFAPIKVYSRFGFNTLVYEQQVAGSEGSVYIDYNNGDVDTLEIDYSPKIMGGSDSPFEGVQKVDFHFNGRLIKTWNFEENPDQRSVVLDFTGVEPNSPDYKEIYGEGIIWLTKEVSDK